jgi:hypothetical protein
VSGQVGTVVEAFSPEVFEVEFLDPEGRTFALTGVDACSDAMSAPASLSSALHA